jgi:hypothetical protein
LTVCCVILHNTSRKVDVFYTKEKTSFLCVFIEMPCHFVTKSHQAQWLGTFKPKFFCRI